MTASAERENIDDGVATSYLAAVRRGVPLRETDGTLTYPTSRSRPRSNFTLDPLHRSLMAISVLVPVLLTVFLATQVPSMPAEVPVQFGFDGSVNRYGSPWEGFWVVAVMAVTIIGVAVLARYPRTFNFPIALSEHNAQVQYKNAVQMMVWLNVSMAVMTLGMISVWFGTLWLGLAWAGVVLMIVTMVFFIHRMFKLR